MAEQIAALWLRLKGYRLLARNWRSPMGEIDILARRGDILVLVEVKSRGEFSAAAEALRAEQAHRLRRALDHYVQLHPQFRDLDRRCDCILFARGYLPQHIKNAWQ